MKTFTDFGEEFVQQLIIDSGKTLDIMLYADAQGPESGEISSPDDPDDSWDEPDFTTEPQGSAYNRQQEAASNFTKSLDNNDDVKISGTVQTFDVSDSTQSVNAVAVVVPFAAETVQDDSGTVTDHLMYTAYLDGTYDLNDFNSTVDLDPVELTLS